MTVFFSYIGINMKTLSCLSSFHIEQLRNTTWRKKKSAKKISLDAPQPHKIKISYLIILPHKIKISFTPLQSLKHLLILFYLSLCCLMIAKKKGVNQNEKQQKMTTSVVTSPEKGWVPHSLLCNKFWGTHMQLLHWCLCICNPLWHSMLLSLHCTISPATKHS